MYGVSGQVNGLSRQGLAEHKYASWKACPDMLVPCPDMAYSGEKTNILEMLSSLDQQLRSMGVCGLIELKFCWNVHDT
jgi:hypothetical protein